MNILTSGLKAYFFNSLESAVNIAERSNSIKHVIFSERLLSIKMTNPNIKHNEMTYYNGKDMQRIEKYKLLLERLTDIKTGVINKIIQTAINVKSKTLDLSKLGIDSLPNDLLEKIPNSVKLLDISGNKIYDIKQISECIQKGIEVRYDNNPACNIGGKNYTLEKIPADTPIIFQWHNINDKYENAECPIINTEKSPYLNNILNVCKIETGRTIGLFMSGNVSKKHKDYLNNLQKSHDNLKIIYSDDLDFSDYFQKKQIDCIKQTIKTLEKNNAHESWIIDVTKDLEKVSKTNPQARMFERFASNKTHSAMDFYRNLILIKGGDIFNDSRTIATGNIRENKSLIYFDCDMIIKKPLGEIFLPDGIGVYNKGGNIENSILAVNRPHHPAFMKGMSLMENDWLNSHPYYGGICKGFKEYFTPKKEESLAKFIAFPVDNIDPDTSTSSGQQTW